MPNMENWEKYLQQVKILAGNKTKGQYLYVMIEVLEKQKHKTAEEEFEGFLEKGEAPFDYERKLILEHGDRVKAILQGKNIPPYELEIQPSSFCNARCIHCFGKEFEPLENRLYNKEAADKIIKEVLEFNREGFQIDNVKFCGSTGEPLMNYLTPYMIGEFSKERKVILFTNGLLIGRAKNYEQYLERIAKADNIVLSLDAGSTTTLWEIKPGMKMSKITIEDILKGVSKIKQISDANVDVSYVINKRNYFDLIKAGRAAKEAGADSLKIRIDMMDRTVSKMYAEDIKRIIHEVKKYEDDTFKVIAIHSDEEIAEIDSSHFHTKGSCFTSSLWACVAPDASIYPCGHIANGRNESYGNLLEKSFPEIWDGEERKRITSNLPEKYCTLCSPSSLRRNELMTFLAKTKQEQGYEAVADIIKEVK
jgi:radical SAM protein with 4Fe4S-binding SPASM domain